MTKLYLIGSLRNAQIPQIGNALRAEGFDVFDDWFSPGPEADEFWQKYEKERGRTYGEALKGWAGTHVFEFDKYHLEQTDIVVMALPTGKSGHLELGWMLGRGKNGYVYFPDGEPDRWDVMYQFATGVAFGFDELVEMIKADGN